MRKTYFAPEMEIMNVQNVGMQAGSMDLNSTTVNGNSALSREDIGGWEWEEDDY